MTALGFCEETDKNGSVQSRSPVDTTCSVGRIKILLGQLF